MTLSQEEEDVLAVMAGQPTIRELLETILERIEKLEANSYPQRFSAPYAPAGSGGMTTSAARFYTVNNTQ